MIVFFFFFYSIRLCVDEIAIAKLGENKFLSNIGACAQKIRE